LIGHRVAAANQLRAHLQSIFPGAELSAELDSPISLTFLARFDCQDRANWLSVKRLAPWLASVGHSGRTPAAELNARLVAAPRGATAYYGAVQAHIAGTLVALLTTLTRQINALSAQTSQQLEEHADRRIFTSLPRIGTVRAARLLAKIGDCRGRNPTPESLACLAGVVAPSSRQSGKSRSVGFRWACDKQLRDAVCDFTGDTRHANPWAADLYQRARDRGDDQTRAVRILARAWRFIIWHCWQDHTAYEPNKHRALQRLLNRTIKQRLDTGHLTPGTALGVATRLMFAI
jgi:transposase